MAECIQCNEDFQAIVPCCDRIFLPGGLKGLPFQKCGADPFVDMTDLAEWEAKLASGEIISTPMVDIVGSMPEPESASVKTDSCAPERPVSYTHTIEVTDHNSEILTAVPGFQQDIFWRHIKQNYRKYGVGAVTCDDRFYGFYTGYSAHIRRVIDDNNAEGMTKWMATISIQEFLERIPVYVPGLATLLDSCEVVS